MRIPTICAALAVLATGAPALSQEAPQDTRSLVLSCIERMKVENGLAESDLTSLQTDHWYQVFGRPYQLRAGGTAADICRLVVAERQGDAYDGLVEDLRAETARANGLQTANGIIQDRLDQYEKPLGISDPRVAYAYLWISENAVLGWLLFAFFFAYFLGHLWSMTPWHKEAKKRAEARKRQKRRGFAFKF